MIITDMLTIILNLLQSPLIWVLLVLTAIVGAAYLMGRAAE